MSQTTTPSGAQVDIAALCDKQVTDWQAAGKMEPYAWDFRGFAADAIARYKAETDPAVAALIARNAELEAQTPSALREKLRSCEEALQAVEADRDALAGERDALRKAVADYMHSEGCSCCRDDEAHMVHEAKLADLLGVEPYDDGSGYNFPAYRTGGAA